MLPPIDPKNGVPIYVQVKEGLKSLVVKGVYPPGAQLPTVRQLAVELRINSNTVARSYAELEREGIISTQQGRGTFVCGLPAALAEDVKGEQLDFLLNQLLNEAFAMGYRAEEVAQRLQEQIRENSTENGGNGNER